jgi:hypothetical protein
VACSFAAGERWHRLHPWASGLSQGQLPASGAASPGYVQTNQQPGVITDLPVVSMPLSWPSGSVSTSKSKLPASAFAMTNGGEARLSMGVGHP